MNTVIHQRKICCILCVFVVLTAAGQRVKPYQLPEVNWSKWDIFYGEESGKAKYLENKQFDQNAFAINSSTSGLAYLKVIDIDGDSQLDLIYDGYLEESLENRSVFYLNKNNILKEVLSINNKIIDINRKWPAGPISFITADLNCCQPDIELISYTHTIKDENIQYEPSRIEIVRNDMEFAAQSFPSLYFTIEKDRIPLLDGPNGNVIKYYDKENTGYAKGSLSDENRIIWWQVYILEIDYKLRLGWVKRDDVKRKF